MRILILLTCVQVCMLYSCTSSFFRLPRLSTHDPIWYTCGGSMDEWLECRTCNSKARNSSPALTASWICSLRSRNQIVDQACTIIASWFASGQLELLTLLSLVWIICFRHLQGLISISAFHTAKGIKMTELLLWWCWWIRLRKLTFVFCKIRAHNLLCL